MSDMIGESAGIPRGRQTRRDSMLLMGTIRALDDPSPERASVRIRNLSATGLMAATDVAFDQGCAVDVEIRGVGLVAGQIIWARDGRIGVTFATPIDPKHARVPEAVGAKDRLWKIVTLGRGRRPGLRID